jgi:hypothetical protein
MIAVRPLLPLPVLAAVLAASLAMPKPSFGQQAQQGKPQLTRILFVLDASTA